MASSRNDVLRCVIFREGDMWVAQGLEHDICVQGCDIDTLNERLEDTIAAEARYARSIGKDDLSHIPPAPDHFFQMYNERSKTTTLKGSDDGRVELALCA